MQSDTEKIRESDSDSPETAFLAMLRGALDSLSAHVAILDSSGSIVAFNEAWRRFSDSGGGCRFAYLGYDYLRVCDQASASGCEDAYRAAMAIRDVLSGVKHTFDMEYPCHSPDEERWFHLRVTAYNGSGLGRVVVTHENVTQAYLAREELLRSRTLLRTVLDLLPVGIFITDATGLIVLHNKAVESIWGAAPHVGPENYDVYPAAWTESGKPLVARDWGLARTLKTREVYLDEMIDICTADGRRKTILNSAIPILGPDGALQGGLAMNQDITMRRQYEQTLAAGEARMRTILESAGLGMCGVDRDGRMTFASSCACAMLGVDESQVPGFALVDALLDGDRPRWQAAMDALLHAGHGEQSVEVKRILEGYGTAVFEIVARPIGAPAGHVHELVVSIADVTERRRHDHQRVQAQKMEAIGQLAAGIAHEINTPTQYIGDNTRFLGDAFNELRQVVDAARRVVLEPDGASMQMLAAAMQHVDLDYLVGEIPNAVQQSLDGVDRVTRIVYSLREFSHPDQPSKSAADLNRVVSSAVTMCRSAWKYVADLDLHPTFRIIPKHMHQALS